MELVRAYSPEQELEMFEGDEYAGFDDDGSGFEGNEYTGLDDDHVDFGGKNTSFATELAANRNFTVVVENTTDAPIRVSFGANMYPDAVPNSVQLKEGDVKGDKSLLCQGQPFSYDFFRKFIERHPTRLIAIKMDSTKEGQLGQSIMTTHVSPFENLGSKPLNPALYTKETSYNPRMLTLKNLNLQLDDQTDISVAIPAKCQTIFTLVVGGIYNTAKTLNDKANRAKKSAKVQAARV